MYFETSDCHKKDKDCVRQSSALFPTVLELGIQSCNSKSALLWSSIGVSKKLTDMSMPMDERRHSRKGLKSHVQLIDVPLSRCSVTSGSLLIEKNGARHV